MKRPPAIAIVVAPFGGLAHYVLHLWDPLGRLARLAWCAQRSEPILEAVSRRRIAVRYGLEAADVAGLVDDGFEIVNLHVATRLVADLESHLRFAEACRARGLRLVHTIHNVLPHSVSRYDPAMLRDFYDLADGFLVGNEREEERLRAGFRVGERAVAIARLGPFTGLDTGRWDRHSSRRALDLPSAPGVILFFGSYRPDKGLEVLIETFPTVAERHPDACLVVSTSPRHGPQHAPFLAGLRAAAESKPGWRLRDEYVPDEEIEPLFRAADVVALPNLRVSQSGVRALAAAFGRAVVLTDAFEDGPSLDGLWGRCVPSHDSAALAAGLIDLLSRPRAERDALGMAGRERALRLESWDENAAAVAALCRRILDT